MPQYTYRCQQCQHTQSLQQTISEAIAPPCPHCGGLTTRIIGVIPTLGRHTTAQPADDPASIPDNHQCGSHCVLHRPRTASPTQEQPS